MTYMIKISQTGEPKLVKVPEKPNPDLEKYVGDSMLWDEDWEEYKQALASALAEEDKHIKFQEPELALKLIYGNPKELIDGLPVNYFYWLENAKGKSYDFPTGWRVEFEYYYLGDNEWVGPVGKSGHEIHLMMGWKTKAVAVLLREQPEEVGKLISHYQNTEPKNPYVITMDYNGLVLDHKNLDGTSVSEEDSKIGKALTFTFQGREPARDHNVMEQPEEKKDIDLYVYETREDSIKHTGARFIAIADSISGHCCFMYTIVDTMAGFENPDEDDKRWKRIMCECFYLEKIKELLSILNY